MGSSVAALWRDSPSRLRWSACESSHEAVPCGATHGGIGSGSLPQRCTVTVSQDFQMLSPWSELL